MPRMTFEPRIPVFEWEKTVGAVDGAAAMNVDDSVIN
jgi:hypothetical protein